LNEVEVKCLPKDLIHSIDVDVSGLEELNSSIHIKDLNIPSSIHVLTDMDRTVVTIAPPKAEQEETTSATAAAPAEGEAKAAEGNEKK
jgi:large subunit ribosomal protein L25